MLRIADQGRYPVSPQRPYILHTIWEQHTGRMRTGPRNQFREIPENSKL